MLGRRAYFLLGPPLIAVAIAVATAVALRGPAGARPAATVATAGTCDARPAPVDLAGAWWQATSTIDADGVLGGYRLRVGDSGGSASEIALPPESSVTGPVRGLVVVAADDGTRSRVDLVAPGARCAWIAYETSALVRRAILDPSSGALVLHLLDRSTRADLGAWLVASDGGEPSMLMPPPSAALLAAAGIARTWSTDLRIAASGDRLVVQSCGDSGCVSRSVDLDGGTPSTPQRIGGDGQGALIGLTPTGIVTWASCVGFPCSIVHSGFDGAAPTVLLRAAVAAAVTPSGLVVATISDAGAEAAVVIDSAGGRPRPLGGTADGLRPVAAGPGATAGLEVAPDQVAFGAVGARPIAVSIPSEVAP